jgi:hypothetical protein
LLCSLLGELWKVTYLVLQNVLRVAPKLPPKPAEMDEEVLAKYPGWSQQSIALGVFAFESFIEDGDNRWSMGALYSVHSLGLLSHFYIQEHAVTLDPSRKISFSSLPSKQPKPRSGEDPFLEVLHYFSIYFGLIVRLSPITENGMGEGV